MLARCTLRLPPAPPGGHRALAGFSPANGRREEEQRAHPPVLRGARARPEEAPRTHGPLRGSDERPPGRHAGSLRVPRRSVGAGDARLRAVRPRSVRRRPRGLEGEDQDGPDPAPGAPAEGRGGSACAPVGRRRLGIPAERGALAVLGARGGSALAPPAPATLVL